MKVAVCMSGHMRTYKHTKESWDKYVFDKYAPDVFIHSWDVMNWNNTIPVDVDDVRETFSPTKLVIENYDLAKAEWELIATKIKTYQSQLPEWNYFNVFNDISAFRKVYLSHALIDSTYDIVIQGRPDLLLQDDVVTIARNALSIDDTTFVVRAPHPSDVARDGHHPPSIAPELCIGRQGTINHLSQIYPNLDMLLHEAKTTNTPRIVLNPNLVVYHWMLRGGFDYTHLPSFDNFSILR